MSGAPVIVYALFASADEARRIARILLDERLVACANILAPCESLYRWQGRIEESREVPALFKTAAERAQAVIARIAALHSYAVPAALAWPIAAAHPPYAQWVAEETADRPAS